MASTSHASNSPASTSPGVSAELTTPTVLRAVEILPDGSTLEVGQLGGQWVGCSRGNRGFVRRLDRYGAELWIRSHEGADETACRNGAAGWLFEDWPHGQGHLVSSRVFSSAFDPWTDRLAVTGELEVAWLDGNGEPIISRSAFAVVLDLTGQVLASRFFGATPAGPAPQEMPCQQMCQGCGAGHQFGGRDVAWQGGDLVVAGWQLPPAPAQGAPFLTRLDGADLSTVWQLSSATATAVDGAALSVAINRKQQIMVTGYGGPQRDVWVALYSQDGLLEASLQTGGSLDDMGRTITEDAVGIRVDGRFTDQITFGAISLGHPQAGPQNFTVWFDDWLGVLAAQADAQPQVSPGPGFGAEVLEILHGERRMGGLDQLTAQDDWNLRLKPDPATSSIDLRVRYLPGSTPGTLNRIQLGLNVNHCADLKVGIQGLVDTTVLPLFDGRLCTDGEQVVMIDVPPEISAALGFDGLSLPHPEDRLILHLELRYAQISCFRPEPDSSIDQIEVDIDLAPKKPVLR